MNEAPEPSSQAGADAAEPKAASPKQSNVWDFPANVVGQAFGQAVTNALPLWVMLPVAAIVLVAAFLSWIAKGLHRIAQRTGHK